MRHVAHTETEFHMYQVDYGNSISFVLKKKKTHKLNWLNIPSMSRGNLLGGWLGGPSYYLYMNISKNILIKDYFIPIKTKKHDDKAERRLADLVLTFY